MREIIDYLVLAASTVNKLSLEVQNMLDDGWQPFNAPVVTPAGYYLQAIVKYRQPAEGV